MRVLLVQRVGTARAGAAGVRGARMRAAQANEDRPSARAPPALTRVPRIAVGTGRLRILSARPTTKPRTIDSPTQQAMTTRRTSGMATPFIPRSTDPQSPAFPEQSGRMHGGQPYGSGAVPSRHGDAARVLLVRAAHGRGRGRPRQGLDLPLPRLPAAYRERVRDAGTLGSRAGAD